MYYYCYCCGEGGGDHHPGTGNRESGIQENDLVTRVQLRSGRARALMLRLSLCSAACWHQLSLTLGLSFSIGLGCLCSLPAHVLKACPLSQRHSGKYPVGVGATGTAAGPSGSNSPVTFWAPGQPFLKGKRADPGDRN